MEIERFRSPLQCYYNSVFMSPLNPSKTSHKQAVPLLSCFAGKRKTLKPRVLKRMSEVDDEITKLFKVRRTVLQMLRDRGYNVEESDLNLKREEFVQKYCTAANRVNKEALFVEANKGPNPDDKIYVIYPECPKAVGVPAIKKEVVKLRDDKVGRGIIVVPVPITSAAKKALIEVNKVVTVEVFEEAELVTNITEHKLINKYYVLDNQAKKELLNKYTVQDTQLPRILVSDPVARYYGLKRGQVVKIRRSDVTSLEYYTYRYAV